jgi:arylsulfatase A-like enzyme
MSYMEILHRCGRWQPVRLLPAARAACGRGPGAGWFGTRAGRRVRAGLGLLAVALAATCAHAARDGARPNILFILTDDQTHRSVSAYPEAYPWVRTPHTDRLAREGMRFAPAYIGSNCIPARANLLTGLHATGIQSLRPSVLATRKDQVPDYWPRFFRKHGYHTAHIGKWHTDGHMGYGVDWDFQKVWSRLVGGREYNLNYQLDQFISTNGAEAVLTGGYPTDNYTQWAVEYIRGQHRDPGKPWYLWLCYDAPHGPFLPAERHRQDYPNVDVPTPADIYPPRPGKPSYMQKVATWVPGPDGVPVMRDSHYRADGVLDRHRERLDFPRTLPDWVRLYHQTVSALDEAVGTLLRTLEETGQRDNTLVVFTSDQGLAIGQHGFFDKHAPYDANIVAPLIVSFPGRIPANTVCDVPVTGVDLIPTFFRFAGIEPPWKMHGRDLTPLLQNPRAAWPHPSLLVYTIAVGGNGIVWGDDSVNIVDESAPLPLRGFRVPWWLLLREGQYKYIRTLVPGEIEELYDIKSDPEELRNLALERRHRDTLERLRKATVEELRRVDAKIVDHLPPVKVVE